jgi:hypothetical protein
MTAAAKFILVAVAVIGISFLNFLVEAVARGFGSSLLGLVAMVGLLGVALWFVLAHLGSEA